MLCSPIQLFSLVTGASGLHCIEKYTKNGANFLAILHKVPNSSSPRGGHREFYFMNQLQGTKFI
jgi:hypothetical protein